MELSQDEVVHWRHRLRDEEHRLRQQFDAEENLLDNEEETDQGIADDAGTWAEREGTQDFLLNLEEGQRREFKAIADAWHRLDEGTFGTCEVCGDPISKARLEAIPYTKRCIQHAVQ